MRYKHRLVSSEIDDDINRMIKVIYDSFGIKISGVEASRIISWKSRCYNMQITSDKLIEILGGKNAVKKKG